MNKKIKGNLENTKTDRNYIVAHSCLGIHEIWTDNKKHIPQTYRQYNYKEYVEEAKGTVIQFTKVRGRNLKEFIDKNININKEELIWGT